MFVTLEWGNAWSQVRSYVRSAPLTYGWLVVLAATTVVQHSLNERLLRSLLQSTSTNLHPVSYTHLTLPTILLV